MGAPCSSLEVSEDEEELLLIKDCQKIETCAVASEDFKDGINALKVYSLGYSGLPDKAK